MALGVPVIGSDGAGAVLERVRHKINGLVFKSGDIEELSKSMQFIAFNPTIAKQMGLGARKTAEAWPVERGAKIILDSLA